MGHRVYAKKRVASFLRTRCKGDPCNMDRRVIWTTSITAYQLLARYTTLFCDDVMLVS